MRRKSDAVRVGCYTRVDGRASNGHGGFTQGFNAFEGVDHRCGTRQSVLGLDEEHNLYRVGGLDVDEVGLGAA